jgi:hypothetical protein
MRSLKLSVLDAFVEWRTRGFARPAAEKFGGAWLACFLVMARGNVLAAFSFEHAFLASVCGIVSAAVAVTHDDFAEGSKVFDAISKGWPLVLSSLKSYLEANRVLYAPW